MGGLEEGHGRIRMPNPDLVEYRLKVGLLLQRNPEKYPIVDEVIKIAEKIGTLPLIAMSMALAIDECFTANMPIAECARRVEEVASSARANALKQWDEIFGKSKETVH